MISDRRVVVTGLGLITPLGLNVSSTWAGLVTGQSGLGRISHFDASDYVSQVAGEVKNFSPEPVLTSKDVRKMDRFIQLGMVAAEEAILMAGLENLTSESKEKTGVFLASGIGGLDGIEKAKENLIEKGPNRISPFFLPSILSNLLAGHVSIRHGLQGPNVCHVSACASGAHAIGDAYLSIMRGETSVMVAGGAEACVTPLAVGGFGAMKALSSNFNATPEQASRPFDKDRDGFVMAEGAGVMVLEEFEHAKARDAEVLAELKGFGQTADAYHMTSPSENGEGGVRAMHQALNAAKLDATDIQYVNAHATSTPLGDEIESRSIEQVFGTSIQVSATKSMTGHMLGAAGAAEAVFSVLSLKNGVVPPTINLENSSEDCRLDYTPGSAKEMVVSNVLSNSFGFGGTNASLIFGRI